MLGLKLNHVSKRGPRSEAALLVADPNYICLWCRCQVWPISSRSETQVDVHGTMFDVKTTFWYLGDLLCTSGGCDSAIAARWCGALVKFRKLLLLITTRHLSPVVHGKVYTSCVHSAMLYVVKCGDRMPVTCRGFTATTAAWFTWSVVSKTKMKHPQHHF